ncbi:VOC family protein [Pyxidicoccus parkwayensis]|uniref:VOC family protein n=1 Tax=Pyxidicoccus parkwayensis TaxID=2813578 RepID=A0ABX7NZM8_9BACT|nr:VOC family protein [Pyxidicoccus parkwaysis]QSQ23923.1 VOC family protein [Pyxidicoccus parkwaysis]
MIDHIMLRVRDYAASKRFYDAVLGTLGYRMVMEFGGDRGGYGDTRKPYFWIGASQEPHPRTHIAFMAKDRAAVDAFHAKALEMGAKSDGAPGVRAHYHPNYYGAFIIDPDGHNVEAVCHTP